MRNRKGARLSVAVFAALVAIVFDSQASPGPQVARALAARGSGSDAMRRDPITPPSHDFAQVVSSENSDEPDGGSEEESDGSPPPATPCGGEERWPVKVGTDDDAAKVSLGEINDNDDIHALNQAERPPELAAPGALQTYEARRTSDGGVSELEIHKIKGWLRFWKYEKVTKPNQKGVDGDFHVVITFAKDSDFAHVNEDATGESMIVEFPSVTCITGRDEAFSDRPKSRFYDRKAGPADLDMFHARKHFVALMKRIIEDEQSKKTCSINRCELAPESAVPVYITGVAFFDREHGQIGRASNGIELHPVLAVERRVLKGQ
jgi:hypothetical protein